MPRLQSNTCSGILAIVWALVGSALPSLAVALAFDVDQRIYLESFQGESSYPTTPEVDETGAGGLTGRAIGPGGGVPGEPELTGSAARVAVLDIGPASGEEVSGLGTLDSSSVGLRGAFDAFTMVGDGSASAGVVAVFDDTFTPTFVAASVLVTRSGGTTSATLRLGQIPLAPTMTTPLSTAFAAALLAGAAFTVDLYVDRDADVMLASVHAPPHEGSISDTLIPMSAIAPRATLGADVRSSVWIFDVEVLEVLYLAFFIITACNGFIERCALKERIHYRGVVMDENAL